MGAIQSNDCSSNWRPGPASLPAQRQLAEARRQASEALEQHGPTDVRQGTSGVSRTSQHVPVDQMLNLLNGLKIF
jgi:hypothetical protein